MSKVELFGELSESFPVTKGLRQGCPTLLWRRACSGLGITINEDTMLYTLHFADGQALIAQDKEDRELKTRLFK